MSSSIPLAALRAFVEVGRRGSIKAAAEALHVTPGAVSQQIRLLEDRLGVALFTRERQGLRLTADGAAAHPLLRQAFSQIEAAVDMLARAPSRQTVTVSTMASFAASWLVPGWRVFARDTRVSSCGSRPRRRWWTCAATAWTWRCGTGSGVIPVCMRCG